MTEEIIIDGVNVAGCVRLQDDKTSCDLGGECKGWENCCYKQLKRLEQEIEAYKQSEQEATEIIAEYEHENERLRIENSSLDNQVHTSMKMVDNCNNRLQLYKSALEKVRAWIKKYEYDANILKHTSEPLKLIDEVLG